jgi:hypothetical protein
MSDRESVSGRKRTAPRAAPRLVSVEYRHASDQVRTPKSTPRDDRLAVRSIASNVTLKGRPPSISYERHAGMRNRAEGGPEIELELHYCGELNSMLTSFPR